MSEDQNLETTEAVDNTPEWVSRIPEKFQNDPEKFIDAYSNLEREYHQSRQEVKGLQETVQTISSQWEEFQAQANRPDPNTVYAQLAEAYENDPIGTMQAIAQSTAQSIYEQQAKQAQQPAGVAPEEFYAWTAQQALGAKYEDFSELAPKISEELQSNPLYQNDNLWGSQELATRAIEHAYESVKARELLAGNSAVQQQLADTRAMKLGAQTSSGAGGRTPAVPDDVAAWERIKAAGNKPYWAP